MLCVQTRPGAQARVQVCIFLKKKKNSSFLLENSIFWAHTGPGAPPGVQVCIKKKKQLISA